VSVCRPIRLGIVPTSARLNCAGKFSAALSNLVVRQEPETRLAPAGHFATRVASPLPVTGSDLVLELSEKTKVKVLPSGETVVFEVPLTFPSFCWLAQLCDRPNLDTHGVKIGIATDFLVLAISFDFDWGNTRLAGVHPILKQIDVWLLGKLAIALSG
jgi:hypothetical protein